MVEVSMDAWNGSVVSFQQFDNLDEAGILAKVGELNGDNHTELTLTRSDPFECLTISGGPDQYFVSGEARGGDFVQLHNPKAPPGEVSMVCGGQTTTLNLFDVVTFEMVRGAVNLFIRGFAKPLPDSWSSE